MRIALALALLAMGYACASQPLVDLLSANALLSPGLYRQEISATLPLRLDTAGSLLVLDPYYVQWETRTTADRYVPALATDARETMQGAGGAITGVLPLGERWKAALAGIIRYHWLGPQGHGDIQPGGAVLISRSVKPTLTMRAGCYMNHDAFGLFVLPLVGVDWRIDAKTSIYGVLPGALTYERKSSRWLHWGASFRAYTTSFGVRDGDYRRINENPVGAYADWYITPHVVLRAEGGWCFFRQVLGGPGDPLFATEGARWKRYADHAIDDAPYARFVLAYRLRLD